MWDTMSMWDTMPMWDTIPQGIHHDVWDTMPHGIGLRGCGRPAVALPAPAAASATVTPRMRRYKGEYRYIAGGAGGVVKVRRALATTWVSLHRPALGAVALRHSRSCEA